MTRVWGVTLYSHGRLVGNFLFSTQQKAEDFVRRSPANPNIVFLNVGYDLDPSPPPVSVSDPAVGSA